MFDAVCANVVASGATLPTFCPKPVKIAFLTSGTYNGALGGLNGADQKCNTAATAAGLKGSFKAWLSDSQGNSPSTRMTHSTVAYKTTNGLLVANDWAGLTSSVLTNAINVTESGATINGNNYTWSNTRPNGGSYWNLNQFTCYDYFSTGGTNQMGLTSATSGAWSNWAASPCSDLNHLTCIQQ
ncbi:MAG: hypothetical protein R8J84_02645 [Mariprofundales bacterium]